MTYEMPWYIHANTTPECPIDEAAKAYTMYQVGMYIQLVYTPIVVIIGLVGNSLSFVIMNKKSNRQISCCFYLCVLAVSDTSLLLGYFSFWLGEVGFNAQSVLLCRIIVWVFNWFSSSSNSLIVCVTLDRYLAICYPLRFLRWRSLHHAKRICASILIFTCIFNIPNLWTSKLVGPNICAAFADGEMFSRVYASIHMAIFSVGAFIAVIILNTCIIKAVHARKHTFPKVRRASVRNSSSIYREQLPQVEGKNVETDVNIEYIDNTQHVTSVEDMTNIKEDVVVAGDVQKQLRKMRFSSNGSVILNLQHTNLHSSVMSMASNSSLPSNYYISSYITINISPSLDRQLAVMLVAVSFAFLLLTLPQFIRYIVYTLIDNIHSAATYARYTLFYNLTNKLHMTNNAINFYVYCLTGSKFRRDFINMLGCLKNRHTYKN